MDFTGLILLESMLGFDSFSFCSFVRVCAVLLHVIANDTRNRSHLLFFTCLTLLLANCSKAVCLCKFFQWFWLVSSYQIKYLASINDLYWAFSQVVVNESIIFFLLRFLWIQNKWKIFSFRCERRQFITSNLNHLNQWTKIISTLFSVVQWNSVLLRLC